MKRRSLVHIDLFFKKIKFAFIKSIYFHFKTPKKQILLFFQKKLRKNLIWRKSSGT